MVIVRTLAALAGGAGAALLFAAPASAQAVQTWVSGVGDDVNPCSRTAPCKSFEGAFVKTATGGEIDCLDAGGFGGVTLTRAVTIDCHAVAGHLLASAPGLNGVNVNISSGDTHVQLIGLHIDGLGAGGASVSGMDGVNVAGANNNVVILDCVISGFQAQPSSAGVLVSGPGAHAVIRDSVIRDNTYGVEVSAAGAMAEIDGSMLDANITANLDMAVAGGKAFLSRSTLTQTTAISNTVGAAVISAGSNFIYGAGAPTSTVPAQ